MSKNTKITLAISWIGAVVLLISFIVTSSRLRYLESYTNKMEASKTQTIKDLKNHIEALKKSYWRGQDSLRMYANVPYPTVTSPVSKESVILKNLASFARYDSTLRAIDKHSNALHAKMWQDEGISSLYKKYEADISLAEMEKKNLIKKFKREHADICRRWSNQLLEEELCVIVNCDPPNYENFSENRGIQNLMESAMKISTPVDSTINEMWDKIYESSVAQKKSAWEKFKAENK